MTHFNEISDDQDLMETLAFLGRAIYYSQSFEANVLTFVGLLNMEEILKQNKNTIPSLESINKSTLGKLLSVARSKITIPESVDNILNLALYKRNYLVHNFFKQKPGCLFSKQGRNSMKKELEQITQFFEEANFKLDTISSSLMIFFGITEEKVDLEVQKMIEDSKKCK